MCKVIMIGCDLHDKNMRLRMAADAGKVVAKVDCHGGYSHRS